MQRVFRVVETAALTPMQLRPSDRMVQSIRRFGVLTPVLLAERVDADGVISLEIIDGNRRVSAAKRAGLDSIPAIVLQDASADVLSAATVITNTLRSKNPVSEWQALESLGEMGRDVQEIGALTGLTSKSYHARMRPGAMPPVLREAMEAGRLTPSTAEAIGRLPRDAQRELARLFEQKGWLSGADVDQVRKRLQLAREPGPVPEVSGQPASEAQLVDQLAVLARYARSIGKGEYEWSKLTGAAWRRGVDPGNDRRDIHEYDPAYDDDDDDPDVGDTGKATSQGP